MRCTQFGKLLSTVTLCAVIGLASAANGATIHTQWTVEGTTTPADLNNSAASPSVAASTGTGTATGLHASAATDWSTPVGNGSANSLSSNEWAIGDYYQFQTSTLGVSGVQLSWAQARSGTGPSNFDLRWSTDGTNFTTAMSYVLGTASFSGVSPNPATEFSANLKSVTALNNQPNVYFRLVATSAPSSTGGTNRWDDFTVTVPEPASGALLLLSAVGLVGIRWSKR